MNVNQLQIGDNISGEYTIKNIAKYTSGKNIPYLTFDINVDLQPIKAIAWEESYSKIEKIFHGQRLTINGRFVNYFGSLQVRCKSLSYSNFQAQKVALATANLRALIAWIPNNSLKEFTLNVFKDQSILDSFFSLPASRNHHHSYSGGLLVHSVDVAMRVFSQHQISENERYVGTIAALFHDIGKVQSLSNKVRTNLYLPHDKLTLEILSPHLSLLDKTDRNLADTLRYLLIWKPSSYDQFPKFEVWEAIKSADHISAGTG